MFQVRIERAAPKFRIDIMNADGSNMPTTATWQASNIRI